MTFSEVVVAAGIALVVLTVAAGVAIGFLWLVSLAFGDVYEPDTSLLEDGER